MTSRVLSPLRARLAREDGFGIIEVLVSALVVALAALGTFAALDSATATSGRNKARSVAASLAQADQERLRALSPSALNSLAPTSTKTVDRREFTITSTAEWIADRSGTPSCSSADGKTDYVKITSSVTWPDRGGIAPVEAHSLKAVPKGAFRPNTGSIAVQVLDRSGSGVAGIPVTITGPATFTGTTNSFGCVIIDQAPVGTYTVEASKSGYVQDKLPLGQTPTEQTVVAKEQTSTTSFVYDLAGTASVNFRTTTTAGGSTVTGTTGDAFTVGHSGLGFPGFISFSLPSATAPTASMSSGSPHTLFPFTSGYAVWAGACAEANPALLTPPIAPPSVVVPPGGTIGPVDVREPRISLTVKRYSSSNSSSSSSTNVSGGRVVIQPEVAGCTRTIILTTNSSGVVTTPLPYGSYSICAQEGTGTSPARRVTVTRVNQVANGTNFSTAYAPNATPPATAAVMLPFNAQSPSLGQCPG